MLRLAFVLPLCAAACADSGPGGIRGPYTGERHRFVIDDIVLPLNNASAREIGDDLNGDGTVDNVTGMVFGFLASFDNLNLHGRDMIGAGAIASTVEIMADDLGSDDAAGLWLYGFDGADAVPVGGTFVNGVFASNRTRSGVHDGRATVSLPIFADADPSRVEIVGLQIDLQPDGRGGYDALVRGGVRTADARQATRIGATQRLATNPQDHRAFWYFVDTDHDGSIEESDFESGTMAAFLSPDVELVVDDRVTPVLSIGYRFHLSPCPEGRCAPPIEEACFDRVRDGDETDVDCGGSCGPCAGGLACAIGADCQTGACDGGSCRPATCDDGLRNGFESSTDCGGTCEGCGGGYRCEFAFDCRSGICNGNTSTCAP